MATLPPLIDALRRMTGGEPGESTDAQLLSRFVADKDAAAFEALVRRHGPLVWGACRRRLEDSHSAEDAFQTTFLALARHAATVRRPAALGAWLHRVAVRCAGAVREAPVPMPAPIPELPSRDRDPAQVAAGRDLERLIDSEIDALPDRLRRTFILCEVEQRTASDVASVLGCPIGTVESRLTRARQRLRARLAHRGVTAGALSGLGLAGLHVPLQARTGAIMLATGKKACPAAWTSAADQAVRSTMTVNAFGYIVAGSIVSVGLGGLLWVLTHAKDSTPFPGQPFAGQQSPRVPLPDPDEFRRDRNNLPLPPEALRRIGDPWLRHAARPTNLAFSGDGQLLAAGSPADHWIRVWDLADRRPRAHFRLRDDEVLANLSLSTDGRTLWTVIRMGQANATQVRAFDTFRGLEIRRFPACDSPPDASAFAPDGRHVVIASEGRVRSIDTATTHERWRADVELGEARIELVTTFDRVAIARPGSATITLLDAATGQSAGELSMGAGARFTLPSVSADGRRLAAQRLDKHEVVIWDLSTRTIVETRVPRTSLFGLAFAPAGDEVVGFTNLGPVAWATSPGESRAPIRGAMGGRAGVFSPDGRRLAIATESGVVQLFDPKTGQADPISPGEILPPEPAEFSPDGSRLLVQVWMGWFDFPTNTDDPPNTLAPGAGANESFVMGALERAAVSPDRTRLVRCTCLDEIEKTFCLDVLDAKTGAELGRIAIPGRVRRPTFSPDGRIVYAVAQDKRVHGWDLATGQEVLVCQQSAGDLVYRLIVSPDGRYLASAVNVIADVQQPNSIRVWNAKTGALVLSADAGFNRPFIAFDPAGRRLAATVASAAGRASPAHEVRVWELETGAVSATFRNCDGQPAFSPDGRTLAITRDDTVVLQELTTGLERHTFRHHGKVEPALAWRPDGRVIAAASSEAPVYLWDVVGDRTTQVAWNPATAEEIDSPDASKAFQAVRRMWAHPARAVLWLKEQVPSSASLRSAVRACEALELPGTPDAIALLREWATGPTDAPRTREAKDSLRRLEVRRS